MGHVTDTTIRPFDEETDGHIFDWFIGHGWSVRPDAGLPEDGVVALSEGKPVAAGWVFISKCNTMAQIAWLVSDPSTSPFIAYSGIDAVIGSLEEIACSRGVSFISFYAGRKGISQMLGRRAYVVGDYDVTQMIKYIGDRQWVCLIS